MLTDVVSVLMSPVVDALIFEPIISIFCLDVKATKKRIPYRLAYYEVYQTRSEAMWREWELKKRWNTSRKKRLVASFDQKRLNSIPGL